VIVITKRNVNLSLSPAGNPVRITVRLDITRQGMQGIRGPIGPVGIDSHHPHSQSTAAAVWTVPHNLGKVPAVTVTDLLGNVLAPDVVVIDDHIIQVVHSLPLAGWCYCN
jgi:hypothetical protein